MRKKIEDIKKKKEEEFLKVPIKKGGEDFFKKIRENREKEERKKEEIKSEIFKDNKDIFYSFDDDKKMGGRGHKKYYIFFLIIIIFITGAFWALQKFSFITIKITPLQKTVNIDSVFSAAYRGTNSNTDFVLETIQISKEDNLDFTASGLIEGGQKATGIVVLYNTYNKNQYLLVDTRLSTPDGKIYKTKKAVTIPVNGSVEVEIYAEKEGAEYNIGLSDFNIVGFKGTDKYEKIYGRAKTPITGGTIEDTPAASQEDIDNIRNILKEKIKNYLFEEINKQVPENYIFYKDALVIEFLEDINNPVAGSIGKSFNYKIRGLATVFLIKEEELTKKLASKYLSLENEDDNEKVYISNIKDLSFSLLTKENNKISFSLKGRANFVWKIDESVLAQELISLKGGDFLSVFKKFPEIEKSEIIFYPSWWNYIPKEKSRIRFEKNIN